MLFYKAQDQATNYGNISLGGWLLINNNGKSTGLDNGIYFGTPYSWDSGERIASNRSQNGGIGPYKGLNFITNSTLRVSINNDGKVGIGTSKPTQLLSVNGTMLVKDVQITTRGSDWPDYVFTKDYSLPSIESLNNFIKKNNHLPGFLSQREIKSQEYYNLNKTTLELLRTVEELTLYIISLDERIKTLEKEK
ncbi:hypothetical protein CMU70_11445 [Elizabethkingia anophelis]|nr:hypothetical protein [Elizabethkingia anophelis]